MKEGETYFFNLRRQRLLRTTRDLAYKLVELALAQHAIAFTFELEGGRTRDNRLAHWAWRTVSGPTHSGTLLAHVDRHGRCHV